MKNDFILEIKGLSKSFPGVKALNNMNIQLQRGEVHGVCGENGAGKSTLMKIITGVYQADDGELLLNGQLLKPKNPSDAYSKGIAIIFQETSLFPDLSVLENLFMGHEIHKKSIVGIKYLDYGSMYKKAEEIFKKLEMEIDLDQKVSDLGVATKQMVEIAKALTFDSQILILDEPTAALTNKEVDTLFSTIKKLQSHGTSMLYISHRLDEIFEIADRVTVIRDGEYVNTEDVKKVSKDQLISWMVGRTLENLYPKIDVILGETVFEVKNIEQSPLLKNISFELRQGEILGIAGLAGAGRTELALAVCGLSKPDKGTIHLNGSPINMTDYKQALNHNIAYISEDRQKYGLVIDMNIRENTTFSLLSKITRLGLINKRKDKDISYKYMDYLDIKAPDNDFTVENLSGGNQQKVSVAKALAVDPQILILDEPTRGVDVGAKSEIHRFISKLASEGKSIIMISSDLPEILGMSDRVLVMKEGLKVGELDRSELSQEKILKMAL